MVKEMGRTRWTNVKVATVVIIAILLTAGICMLYTVLCPPICTNHFPVESNQWCSSKGDYWIAALDYYDNVEGWEYGKQITLVNITDMNGGAHPNLTATLSYWNVTDWAEIGDIPFPLPNDEIYPRNSIIPLCYNDYSVMEDLLFVSLGNILLEYDGEMINFSISSHEQYITCVQEIYPTMDWYNGEYIIDGYYYGIVYIMEAYFTGGGFTFYLKLEVAADCATGIPLYESFTFVIVTLGATALIRLNTVATSVTLVPV